MEHLRERLRNLLLLLLEALDTRQEGHTVAPADLRELIAAAGYDEADMQDLLSWFSGRWHSEADGQAWLATRRLGRPSEDALRQMGPREDELLTVPAFGYLIGLVNSGQITAEQMESLIQFAQLVPDGPLTLGELGPLLERVVFTGGIGLDPYRDGQPPRSH